MPWLRLGDNIATHPRVLRVGALPGADERTVNEVFGFVMRCALQSAGHTTDYYVDAGTVYMLGGSRTDALLEMALKVGYMTKAKFPGTKLPAFKLIDDPEFLHIRLKAEIDWERQQRQDTSNPALTVPVRLRDGDSCRYCAKIVQWGARKGARAGTYDHRAPGKPATVDTFVVACGGCNAGRGNDPNADDRYPLRPAPATPYYSEKSAEFLQRNGHLVHANIDPQRLDSQSNTAPSDRAASATTPPPPNTAAQVESADFRPTDRGGTGTGLGLVGTGRDGAGGRPRDQTRVARSRSRGRSARGRPR